MTTREFRYNDSKSDKFWKITLDGATHTVHYGRVGTQGQQKTKEFDSDTKALADSNKLIAQKTKKGYVEIQRAETQTDPPSSDEKPPVLKTLSSPAVERGLQASVEASSTNEPRAVTEPPIPSDSQAATEPSSTSTAALQSTIGLSASERRFDPDYVSAEGAVSPPPFDLDRCIKRLRSVKASNYGWFWNWSLAQIDTPMTRAEAHFWLLAATVDKHSGASPTGQARELSRRADFGEDVPSLDVALLRLADHTPAGFWGMAILVSLYEANEVLDAIMLPQTPTKAYQGEHVYGALPGVGPHLVPRLSEARLRQARDQLAQRLSTLAWPDDYYTPPHTEFLLAAGLRMYDVVERVVAEIPDGRYKGESWYDHYQRPQLMVLSLRSPERIAYELDRLGLHLRQPWHLAAWLARTGDDGLPRAVESIVEVTNRDDAEPMLEVLNRGDSPALAQPMLQLMLNSRAPAIAREWLLAHPASSILGLSGLLGRAGRVGESALDVVKAASNRTSEPTLRECVDRLPDSVRKLFVERVVNDPERSMTELEEEPEWMREGREALEGTKKRFKMPSWLDADDLPILVIEDQKLSAPQVALIVQAAAQSSFDVVHPLLTGLRNHGDPARNDAFAWRLFETWLSVGANSKEKWAMMALAHLGVDASALKLTPLIRKWPGESQHQRAVLGLGCLEGIGTDTALMQINGIAQKVKFKALKTRAQQAMESIAKKRGMSRAELEDRIVPDCGLDERGRRSFDFGPRRFDFVLGPDMKPMVRDEKGKLKANLPKPGAKDDTALANASIADWKLLKKQVKDVAAIQAARLEQAMVAGRRWSKQEFVDFFVTHPLQTHLARLLLWGSYADGAKRPAAMFRVTEERDLADRDDEPFELPADGKIGLVHPLQLTEDDLAAWGEVFSDYELVPAFAQLGRPTYTLESGEADAVVLDRFKARKVAATTLVGTLEKLGWARGMAEDGGVFSEHSKPFYAAGTTAIVQYEGVPMGYMVDWDDQSVEACFFIEGIYDGTDWYPRHKNRLRLGDVDSLVLSEVLNDLNTLASKAK